METLKIIFENGQEKEYTCKNCKEALLRLKALAKHKNVRHAWYRNIDLNLSYSCLHEILSRLLRRDNNPDLGKKYMEVIQLKNTIFN